ncbi:hypothetical protein BDV93DRAFT_573529 [Ceratobasidium sp. AG-I]|nr:hypothetical protein BDV93DRAFT_573529 [Ceratobasidium sp. AG-I]
MFSHEYGFHCLQVIVVAIMTGVLIQKNALEDLISSWPVLPNQQARVALDVLALRARYVVKPSNVLASAGWFFDTFGFSGSPENIYLLSVGGVRNDPIFMSKLRHLAFRSSLHASAEDCLFLTPIVQNYESEAGHVYVPRHHGVDEEDVRLLLGDYTRRISTDVKFGIFDLGLALTFVPWIQDTLIWYNKPHRNLEFVLAEIEGLWQILSLSWSRNLSVNPFEARFFEVLATQTAPNPRVKRECLEGVLRMDFVALVGQTTLRLALPVVVDASDNFYPGFEDENRTQYISDMFRAWEIAGEVLHFNQRASTSCSNPGCEVLGTPSLSCERCYSAFYCNRSCQEQHWFYPSIDKGHSWNCRMPKPE